MTWMAAAVAGSSVIGAGTSMYQGAKNRAAMKDSMGYDIVDAKQYSFTEPNLRLTSDFLSDSMQRLGEGKAPAYWDEAMPEIRKGMSDPLYETYFGRPGERSGIVQQSMNVGAMTGAGPKGAMAHSSKAMKDWAMQESQIDRYLAEMGVKVRAQEAKYLPMYMMNMPEGPSQSIVNYGGGVSSMGGNQGTDMSFLQDVPWENMFQPSPNMGGGGTSQYGNVYGSGTPAGVQDMGTYSRLP